MQRDRVLVGVLGGLLLAGVAVFLLLRGGDAGAPDSVNVLTKSATAGAGADARRADVPVPSDAALPDALPAAPALAAAEVPTGKAALPESYRRALGGLTGRVIEAAGTPVAGMTIELVGGRKSLVMLPRNALLADGGLEVSPIVGSAVTEADGRFRMTDLEPRTFGALILDPGGPRALLHPLEFTPTSGMEKDLGDITLPATATLKGRITDERGAGLPGVRVRATELPMAAMPGIDSVVGAIAGFRLNGALLIPANTDGNEHDLIFTAPASVARLESHLPIPTTTTDASGGFVLPGVIPGIILFAADDGVHLPLVKTAVPTGAAGATRDMGTMPMGDGLTLHGRVMSDKGEPIAGAELLCGNTLGIAPVALLKSPVRSNAEGRFEVRGLQPGLVWTAARTDRRREFTASATDDLSREFIVTLASPRSVRVTVLDSLGKPLTEARFFGRVTEEDEIPDFILPPRPIEAQPVADLPGVFTLSDLQPAPWEFAVSVPGHGLKREQVDLTSGDGAFEARLTAGRALAVRVVRDSDEAPVEYAFVEAYQSDDESPDTAVRTGADGRARLEDLAPGEVTLLVTHPALAITQQKTTVSQALPTAGAASAAGGAGSGAGRLASAGTPAGGAPGAEATEIVIRLLASGSITGSVVDNGGPPAEPLMIVLEPRGAEGDGELPRITLSDPEGNFRFDQVEGGSTHLEARSRLDLQSGLNFFEAFFNSPLAEDTVEVPAGGEAQALLVVGGNLADVDTAWLSGTLTVNGRAAEGWKVRTFGEIRRTAVADAAGRWDLGRIEAGQATLAFSAPGTSLMEGATESQQVELTKDEHRFLEVRFATGGVRGRVLSAQDGHGLPGVRVTASPEGQEGGWFRQSGGVTMADGSFELDTLAAGRYRVTARAENYANASSEPFTVTEQALVDGVELRLVRALIVKGRLSVTGVETKPRWMWLVAQGKDGTGRDTADVDRKTGAFSFNGLAPGEWTFTLATDLDTEFAPLTQRLDNNVEDLQLVFVPAPEQAEEAEVVTDGTVTIEVGK